VLLVSTHADADAADAESAVLSRSMMLLPYGL
jgi:hypothetical protein